ncbi:MAG: ABC transporter permease [Ignavibacteriaceae bacterium]
MSFSFFITKKYTFSRKNSRFINLISTVAVTGIALGVAALIIALSVLNGFEKTLTEKIIDFDAHIQINSYRSSLPDYHTILPQLRDSLPAGTAINPYVSNLAIISSRKVQEGINIKGISTDSRAIRVEQNITEGRFSSISEDGKIIIGRKLANKLRVKLGDRVTLFALVNDQLPSPANLPNIRKYTIGGIFESGMAEYDDLIAYVNMKSAQELFNIGDNISGYDIKLKDISKIDSITESLNNKLRYPHYARSIYQTHRNIFTWIDLQKKPIPIILGLIIIVAVFNIVGTLFMIVLEKTNAIGILKSIGAKGKQIVKIFVYQGMFLAVIGIVAGNLLAFVLTYLQMKFEIITIPSSVYFMSSIPVLLKPENFVLVSVLTFVLCILASLIPSYVASKINPVSTLRFG